MSNDRRRKKERRKKEKNKWDPLNKYNFSNPNKEGIQKVGRNKTLEIIENL